MRVALVSVVLAALAGLPACGGRADRGPAWPRSAGTEVPDDASGDGGESLEPHTSEHPAAALESSEDVTTLVVAPPLPEPTPTAEPTVTPIPTVPVGSETMEINVEEIIITPSDAPPE